MSGNDNRETDMDWLAFDDGADAQVETYRVCDTGDGNAELNYEIISGALHEFFGTEVAADSESITQALAARNGDLGTAVQHLLDQVPSGHNIELAQVLPIRTYGLGDQLGGQYLGRLEEIQQLTPEPYDAGLDISYLL